jgi:hypothetical protein
LRRFENINVVDTALGIKNRNQEAIMATVTPPPLAAGDRLSLAKFMRR